MVLLLASAAAPAGRAAEGPSSIRIWTETGYGETKNDAQQQALENARSWVELHLYERFHDIGWAPKNAAELVDMGVIRVDEPKEKQLDKLGQGYEAAAHVDLTDGSLRKIQEQVDKARKIAMEPTVSWRHIFIGRVLASLVALFLVVFGYLRLEELTRGYYTTLLRLTAAGVVLATVVGLFLVF